MKICIACHVEKPLDEFYRHPYMTDGHQGVCKECHKARMRLRQATDPAVRAYDRARQQRPERQAHTTANAARWRVDHPEKYVAQTAVNNALRDGRLVKKPCEICGATENVHGHHDDYSKPLDVRWLCALDHARLHARLHAEELQL